jgi:hypothetical protein
MDYRLCPMTKSNGWMRSWRVPKRRDTLSRLVKDVVRRFRRVGVRRELPATGGGASLADAA